jgi:anti-sigma factor RsiW
MSSDMTHSEAIDLLAWYVTESLDADERAAVARHLESCETCKQEVRELSLVHQSVAEVGSEEPAYRPAIVDEALARIDQLTSERKRAPRGPFAALAAALRGLGHGIGWDATPVFARVALVAQFALLIAIGTIAMRERPIAVDRPVFATSAGQQSVPAGARLSVAFRDSATMAQVQTLLGELDSQVVAGPTALGLYTIAIGPRTNVDQVARQLQASGLATFVAPVAR